jgi:diguanylate cyclase (GGDEF)-like protein
VKAVRFDEGPILRQVASYIQALPPEKRLLKDPAADAQRSFLEIFLGTADLLDFMLSDPRSPLRRAGGRIFQPDPEDQELRRRIQKDGAPLRVDLRRDFEETDSLTGLLNKNHYLKTAPRIFQNARENGEALSMLVFDLDHFKAVNDARGHPFGDEILRAAAQVVLASMRQEDTAMRFGGEEVVVIVRGDYRAAFAQGERVRNNLNELLAGRYERELAAIPEIMASREFEERRRTQPDSVESREAILRRWQMTPIGTASIGVAQGLGDVPFPCEQETDLLSRADRMLYLAKASGRNRVVGMVDRLRLPLLVEEYRDFMLFLQESPARRPEDFPRQRQSAGRPLRFASYIYEEFFRS